MALFLSCTTSSMNRNIEPLELSQPSVSNMVEIPPGAYILRIRPNGAYAILRVEAVVEIDPCEFSGVNIGYMPKRVLYDGQGGRSPLAGLSVVGFVSVSNYRSIESARDSILSGAVLFLPDPVCWKVPQVEATEWQMLVFK